MKRQDMIMLLLVVMLGAMLSFFISNALFSSPQKRQLKVEVVERISSNFPDPKSKEYSSFFNSSSLNPTQNISIGDTPSNAKPFGSGNLIQKR